MAGRKRGQEDDRYLWPEFKRLIGDIRPDFVVGENVPGIIKSASDTVCKDLESEGYSVRIFNFEATAVGAFHRRDRVFFVAHQKDLTLMEDSRCKLLQRGIIGGEAEDEGREWTTHISERSGKARVISVSNPDSLRCDMWGSEGQRIQRGITALNEVDSGGEIVSYTDSNRQLQQEGSISNIRGWAGNSSTKSGGQLSRIYQSAVNSSSLSGGRIESCMGGLADGTSLQLDGGRGVAIDDNYINLHYWEMVPEPKERIKKAVPNRASQLRALGNAVVPQQMYPIFKAVIETSKRIVDNN